MRRTLAALSAAVMKRAPYALLGAAALALAVLVLIPHMYYD